MTSYTPKTIEVILQIFKLIFAYTDNKAVELLSTLIVYA